MEALGRVLDISAGIVVVDTQTGAMTGKRVSLKHATGISVVLHKGAGTGSDDPVLTFKQHTASTGGTSANLAVVDHYYKKSATTLAGTETWSKVTQTASQTVTLTSEATKQGIYVFEIAANSLTDTYGYVSLDVADTGSAGAQLGTVLYILHGLEIQRTPANLVAALA